MVAEKTYSAVNQIIDVHLFCYAFREARIVGARRTYVGELILPEDTAGNRRIGVEGEPQAS